MKKRVFSFFLALAMVASALSIAQVAEARASDYLAAYSVSVTPKGSRQMCIVFTVSGTGKMTKIGAEEIKIQKKTGTTWSTVQTLTPSTNPEMMGANLYDHGAAIYFTGELNAVYQLIITVYAGNAKGGDRRTVESPDALCK